MKKNILAYLIVFALVLTSYQFAIAGSNENLTIPKPLLNAFDKGYNGISYTLLETKSGAKHQQATMEIQCKNSSTYRIETIDKNNENTVIGVNPKNSWIHNVKDNTVIVSDANPDADFKAVIINASKISEGNDGIFLTYEIKSSKSRNVTILYLDPKENFIAKQIMKNSKGKVILQSETFNLKREKHDDSLFEVPKGAKIVK